MLKRLINSLLLTGKYRIDKDTNNTQFIKKKWKIKSCQIEMFGETISQKYFLYRSFDEKKDTIIYWPGNTGAKYFLNDYIQLGEKYNIIIPEFFGYPLQLEYSDNKVENNIPQKCKSLTFDHVVEAAEKVTEKIRNELKELYKISDDQTVNQKINLLGFSMGSMIAMKIAAKNEMNSPFKSVYVIAPVIII